MSKDRIGSACWYRIENNSWTAGTILAWTVAADIVGKPEPVAIIEDSKKLKPMIVPIHCISFLSVPE